MGNQTRMFIKIDVSYEDAKTYLLDKYQRTLGFYSKQIKGEHSSPFSTTINPAYYTKERCEYGIEVIKRKIRLVENGYCKLAVMHSYQDDRVSQETFYLPEKGMYIEHQLLVFYDIFVPEELNNSTILFSMDETREYLDTNKWRSMFTSDQAVLRLREFWDQNPDGLIKFN